MKVRVKGMVMEKFERDGKYIYFLYQTGEREIIRVRAGDGYQEGDEAEFEGKLLIWANKRGNVDYMVLVE